MCRPPAAEMPPSLPDGQGRDFYWPRNLPLLQQLWKAVPGAPTVWPGTDGSIEPLHQDLTGSQCPVTCHLSPLIGAKSVAQKKVPTCFLFDCWAG